MVKLFTAPFRSLWARFKNFSLKKKLLTVFVLIVVIGIAARQITKNNNGSQYELEAVRRDSITEVVSETGNVTATGAIPIYSTSTGLVEQVFVSNGDTVTKDQPLFQVASTATKQEKDTALSNYLTAKTAYETAKATELSLQATMFTEWDEFKELAEGDDYEDDDGNPKHDQRTLPEFHVPEKQWLAAEANYKKQQFAVSQAAAQMSATWQAYQATQDSKITAVLGGEIKNLGITPGDTVAAPTVTTLSSTPPALVVFNPTAPTVVSIEVGETDAVKIKAGQTATVEFDALPHKTFDAVVDRVDSFTHPQGGVVNYTVYVTINDPVDQIKGGMTADVDVVVATKENVLTVPSSAVKPHEGGRAVRVVENGDIKFIPVETGSRGDGRTEIISGIDEGIEVITALKNDQVERSSASFF